MRLDPATGMSVWFRDHIRLEHTGRGAHGLYPSRDSRVLYVSNRGAGTITLISFRMLVCGRRRAYAPDATGRVEWRFCCSSGAGVCGSAGTTLLFTRKARGLGLSERHSGRR
jgi:hypothetical protein